MSLHASQPMLHRLLCLWLAVTVCVTGRAADSSGRGSPGTAPKSQVGWHISVTEASPDSEVLVALELQHPAGWHSYYRNSGGPELPLEIRWQLPEGWSVGEIRWPTPSVKNGFFGKSFIYEGSPVFVVPLRVSGNAQAGSEARVVAQATWQICEKGCVSEHSRFETSIRIATESVSSPDSAALFLKADQTLPRRLPEGWRVLVQPGPGVESLRLKLQMTSDSAWTPKDLVPALPFVKSASDGGSLRRDADGWEMVLPLVKENALGQEIKPGDSISGVLLGEPAYAFGPVDLGNPATGGNDAVQPEPGSMSSNRASDGRTHWLAVLGGMFFGGLILNLMPCVFPVIGLKVMGFVQQSGGDRRKVMLHGWVFALGIWVSFAVIAGGLWFLRTSGGGPAPAWGYQLQDPRMVYGLLVLMWLLGLNMAGLFEIGASATSVGGALQQRHDLTGSFFSGVLATVVATPCSAPYLGSAMAVAVTLPPLGYTLAFGAMATGLALPYLMLSAFPKLMEVLPRPGAWMERFKQGMSFLLFATAGYLLWVYAGQIGLDALLLPLFSLVQCCAHIVFSLPSIAGELRR